MQGFNKYYPPDYDGEKHGSLNSYRGKHALGDRARKLDQGILITRFELPFNIWCGTCNNHIGMGVRYNAEKKKIGSYYSTPIFSFRCKCHLCDGWFEIQTDPKNTCYVVITGARKKDEDWDPEENGGFAIHETDGNVGPADPLTALEKSTDAQNHLAMVQVPRLESLYNVSEHYNSDPYALSLKVRKHFRKDKAIERAKKIADDSIKGRYALPESLTLLADDDSVSEEAKKEWEKGRQDLQLQESMKRRKLDAEILAIPSSIPSSPWKSTSKRSSIPTRQSFHPQSAVSLRRRILENTARQLDSFSPARKKPPNKTGTVLFK